MKTDGTNDGAQSEDQRRSNQFSGNTQNAIRSIERQLNQMMTAVEEHPVFDELDSFTDIRVFLEQYAYAVWDFNVLVEAFRNPEEAPNPFPGPPVVLAKAEDKDWTDEIGHRETPRGFLRPSHDVYTGSLEALGGNPEDIHVLISSYREKMDIETALATAGASPEVRNHVLTTWNIAQSGDIHRIAGALAFGRRDIISDEFSEKLKNLHPETVDYTVDSYRHHNRFSLPMELNWEKHGERILGDNRITSSDNWETEMEVSARKMLEARNELLNSIKGGLST